jgi:glycosyltransferase involved in cell wall biosynthesis
MRICFITVMDIKLPTMKRATGMAMPLIEHGHHVSIVSWDTQANRERYAFECPKVEPLWIPKTNNAFVDVRNKYRAVNQWKPDIVYVCAFGMRNFIVKQLLKKQKSKVPVVLIEHSELSSAIKNQPRWRQTGMRLLEKISILGSDGLLCASPYLTEVFGLSKRLYNCRQKVLYFPYAFNRNITKVPEDIVKVVKSHILPGKKRILYMGTLSVNYGILDILRAIKQLRGRRSDFNFYVLGSGRHAEQARRTANDEGVSEYTKFMGFVAEEHLGAWFSEADVFVAPLKDTVQDKARCPSKVYMYLPFQKPIVSCKIGDPYHTLGSDGFYYEPGDVNGLAMALDNALDHSEHWSPRFVQVEQHSWEARTEQFLEWCWENGWLEKHDS